MRTALMAALLFSLQPASAFAQDTYTQITAAVELPNGSVVVLDQREHEVWLLQQGLVRREPLVTSGAGPGEMRVPANLVPAPDRSVMLWDIVQTRMTRCAPEKQPRCRTITLAGENAPALQLLGVDEFDRTYHADPPGEGNGDIPDSSTVTRYDKATGTFIPVVRLEWTPSFVMVREVKRAGSTQINRFGMPVPLVSGDQIAILPDGEVVAISGYGTELVRASEGRTTRVPLTPRRAQQPVTAAERDSILRKADSLQMGESVRKIMPVSKRAFRPGTLHLSPNNHLWVAYYEAGKATRLRYDGYALTGKRLGEVDVALNCRIVGVGRKSYYTACRDEDDLETLVAVPVPQWER